MKKFLVLFFFPLMLHAESYIFSAGKNSMPQIIASQILIKAYANAGIEITPLFLELNESLQRSNRGDTDGEIARISGIAQIFPNLRKIPVSIMSVEAVAFSKNTSLEIQNWSDLNGHKVTIVKGIKFIEAETKDISKQQVVTFEEAFKRLNKNETDIIVIPKLAGWNIIYKNKYKNIRAISPVLKAMKLYHFVHTKNSHLIPVVTPILMKMEQSGEISYMQDAHLNKFINNQDN